MVDLSMPRIAEAFKNVELPAVDLIVGIATGGTVPASIIAYRLDKELVMLPVNFRDPQNNPRHESPVLTAEKPHFPADVEHLLLVDDVSVSGKTMDFARRQLPDVQITTLVLKGKADIVLFPEVGQCVNWPWKV